MNPGGHGGRVRQYISFFLLAVVLGLFVRAMAGVDDTSQSALVALSFGSPVAYTKSVDKYAGTVTLTFPTLTKLHLEKECLQLVQKDGQDVLESVSVHAAREGAQLRFTLSDTDNTRVEVVDSMGAHKPNQLVVVMSKKPTCYGTLQGKPVMFASASLYTV